jgi:hypothetical protein
MLAVLGVMLLTSGATAPQPEEVRRVMEHGQYQTELPLAAPAPPGPSVDGPNEADDEIGETSGAAPGPAPRSPNVIRIPAASGLAWAVLIAVVLSVLLAWIVKARRPGPDEPVAARARPNRGPVAAPPLAAIEALAREGRFAEAIHALLLSSFDVLGERWVAQAERSLTSREVLVRTQLASEAREPLAALVSSVERVHFGAAPAAREDYEGALGYYRQFLARCRPTT